MLCINDLFVKIPIDIACELDESVCASEKSRLASPRRVFNPHLSRLFYVSLLSG
jgi:hypothetical protein